MSTFVPPERQLVAEVTVTNLQRSIDFYCKIGFTLIRAEEHFAELGWEGSKLLLDERANYVPPAVLAGNIRVLVPRVDDYWKLCNDNDLPIFQPIQDRYYGLRDFTVLDPDGYGVRFASDIPQS